MDFHFKEFRIPFAFENKSALPLLLVENVCKCFVFLESFNLFLLPTFQNISGKIKELYLAVRHER
jgi:hypothetical protein